MLNIEGNNKNPLKMRMLLFLRVIIKNRVKKIEEQLTNYLYSRIEEDPDFVFHAALGFTFILTVLILQFLFG